MSSAKRMSADHVASVLRAGPFRDGGHAWLEQVRNGTGYERSQRYADAVVISCWPSRGIWFAGIEIKVNRQDWKRELDQPQKAAEVQRWCHYWYVAAPTGIVEAGEVPETWGHYAIDGKKAVLVKPAPRLEPEPLSPLFVASLLRNQVAILEAARRAGHNEGWLEASEKNGSAALEAAEKTLREVRRDLDRATSELSWKERELRQRQHERDEFERITGVRLIGGDQRNVAEQYKLACALQQIRPGLLANHLDELAAALRALDVPTEAA